MPKIGAKSKYLDEKKGKDGLTRHERLLQMVSLIRGLLMIGGGVLSS